MTDLEMTKLCAEAMGFDASFSDGRYWAPCARGGEWLGKDWVGGKLYDPLHDDAQAMALVKKIVLLNDWHPKLKLWSIFTKVCGNDFEAMSPDLNRAIVECVAKMQQAKNG